jgi:hypothetical protein
MRAPRLTAGESDRPDSFHLDMPDHKEDAMTETYTSELASSNSLK